MKNVGLFLPLLSVLFVSDPALSRGKLRSDSPEMPGLGAEEIFLIVPNPPQPEQDFSPLSSPSDGSQTPVEQLSPEPSFAPSELSSQLFSLHLEQTQLPEPPFSNQTIQAPPPLNRHPALVGQLLLEAFGIIHAVSGGQ
jgi:hypothetical protein